MTAKARSHTMRDKEVGLEWMSSIRPLPSAQDREPDRQPAKSTWDKTAVAAEAAPAFAMVRKQMLTKITK